MSFASHPCFSGLTLCISACPPTANSPLFVAGNQRVFSLVWSLLPVLRKMSQRIPQLAQQIATLLRGNLQGSYIWEDAFGNVGASPGIQSRSVHLADLDNPAIFFQFFTSALEFAIFPRAMRHRHAAVTGVKSRADSRAWNIYRERDLPQGPNWKHANLTDSVSVAPLKVFLRLGKCPYPLYVTPTMAKDMSDM